MEILEMGVILAVVANSFRLVHILGAVFHTYGGR